MEYRRLGSAGVKLSEIGLGGWLTFGNALEAEQAKAVMNTAFDVGINFFDTADAYSEGKCEEAWGQLLSEHRRASYILATKVFFPTGPGPNDRGLSRKHIVENCHLSLKRLKTDYLDILQCHRFDTEVPVEETVRAMDDLVRQGKILYWGFSEWTAQQIEQCLRICGDRWERPRSSQPRYSAVQREVEKEVFPLCQTAGIGQVVFSPLAQGVLSGKYKPGQPVPTDSRAADDRQNQFIQRFLQNQTMLERIQHLASVAEVHACTMSQLALAWALRRHEVTSCIVGASRPAQLIENAKASGLKLRAAEIAQIDDILMLD